MSDIHCGMEAFVNRFGDIGVIDRRVDSTDETSLDDIENVDTMMDIVSNFV